MDTESLKQNSSPLISIIIPVYNAQEYLEQCLDSVCRQTYTNIEIIAVNDGSTDNSEEKLREHADRDSRIHIVSQENSGVSAARNTGLRSASGDLIMFLDGDDWIDEDTCRSALNVMTENDSDIVLWSYVREYEKASKPVELFGAEPKIWDETNIDELRLRTVGLVDVQLKEPQRIDSMITVWGKLYKRSVIDGLCFEDMDIIGSEDTLFSIFAFSKVKSASYIPMCYYHYRKTNDSSLTHKYKADRVYQWMELYDRIRRHLDETGAGKKYYTALFNRKSLGLIGLGLNLAEDKRINIFKKSKELRKILKMPHYSEALKKLPLKFFPIHWKCFFFLAKRKLSFLLSLMLVAMNCLRGS